MSHCTPRNQRLGAATAAVIIVIVVTVAALAQGLTGYPSSPQGILVLVAAAALVGVLTTRLAAIGLVCQVQELLARTLALAPTQC
jgi:hypothetical protein